MAGDASFASVSLLLHCDGSNGSTTFTDSSSSPKTPTVNGNAKISTTQSKFGGTSMYFDGTGDYLAYAASADFGFGTGDFTLEGFFRFDSVATDTGLFDFRSSGGSDVGTFFMETSSKKLVFYYGTMLGGTGATALTTGTWYHIALCRAAGTTRCYLDGVEQWNSGSSYNFGSSRPLGIGGSVATGLFGTSPMNGYIDELRITKGVARYTSGFSAPTAAFPDGMGQVSGNVKDSAGANAVRTVRAYRRDTGALVGNTTSDASGNYSFYTPTLDELTVIALDDHTSGTYYNDQVARVIPA